MMLFAVLCTVAYALKTIADLQALSIRTSYALAAVGTAAGFVLYWSFYARDARGEATLGKELSEAEPSTQNTPAAP
jgi:hypothetical protein